ncbi:hypothetical protein PCAR4_110026 [Paraburkholderia caribensis]|nr:hypothetical protein BCAR13_800075 [Paraburkholderia caribensis]CAG9241784.1 hypothetical protein PCAR4_110026 [Paraburkholderia caribensis]
MSGRAPNWRAGARGRRLMLVGCQDPRRVGPLFEAVFACALRLRVHLLETAPISGNSPAIFPAPACL